MESLRARKAQSGMQLQKWVKEETMLKYRKDWTNPEILIIHKVIEGNAPIYHGK